MPKLGVKYFIGSFLLSLVAVFAATKAYIVVNMNEQQTQSEVLSVEARNIELFAANEENDPLYEKFKQVSQPDDPLPADNQVIEATETESSDEVLYTENTELDDTILYEPEEIADAEDSSTSADVQIAEASENDLSTEDLQIADASLAPVFMIPLKHNYNIEGGTISVSDSADKGKIALASHDVSIYNLGTENQAEVTDPLNTDEIADTENESLADELQTASPLGYTYKSEQLAADVASPQMDDDPWEVAETSNKYVAKNSLGAKSEEEHKEVAMPDKQVENVTYKPQQNILIPIPEDIMNEENLTPQFSTSKENLKIEEELRAKHQLPELNKSSDAKDSATEGGATGTGENINGDGTAAIPSIDDERDFDDVENDEEEQTSRSLTDSITAWFSGSKSKNEDSLSLETPKAQASAVGTGENVRKTEGKSIFQRLLGDNEDEKENIIPSELKISFQPDKSGVSGTTVDWIRAFAGKSLEDENTAIEIRVDESAPVALQQKRLKLLYKLLVDSGVDSRKINIIFTTRDPNSFIIRNVHYVPGEQTRSTAKAADNPWW